MSMPVTVVRQLDADPDVSRRAELLGRFPRDGEPHEHRVPGA